ncbi:unnamed protein product, partial [Medioppia subpectinata]
MGKMFGKNPTHAHRLLRERLQPGNCPQRYKGYQSEGMMGLVYRSLLSCVLNVIDGDATKDCREEGIEVAKQYLQNFANRILWEDYIHWKTLADVMIAVSLLTSFDMTADTYAATTEPSLGLSDGSVHIEWPDYLVIALYFISILGVGFWSSRKSKGDSVDGYFLANRSMHWIPVGLATVGASLFSSNVGSGSFVGLAGSGASSGLSIAAFELNALFVLLVLAYFFLPVYIASGVSTMPEYLRKRFGGQRIRIYMSVLALLLYIFTKISADLYAGALFIKQSLGLNMYVSVVILLAISAVFTMAGGLTTVIWTDTVQTFLMVIGALVLTILSLNEVGREYNNPSGYNELMDNFRTRGESKNPHYIIIDNSTNQSCSAITPYYRNLLRPWDDVDLPWTGMVFGITISAVWYWCSDQVIVQRALSARSYSHAKAGCTLCSFIKISPFYLLVMPGMAARALWP